MANTEDNLDSDYVLVDHDPVPDPMVLATGLLPRRWRRIAAEAALRRGTPERDTPLPLHLFEALYRHHHGADLTDFHAADDLPLRVVNPHHGVRVIDARDHGLRAPTDRCLPPAHDTVFVLRATDGRTYLVNSEAPDRANGVSSPGPVYRF